MKCTACTAVYDGQTDRSFEQRFKEYIRSLDKNKYHFCKHIKNTGYLASFVLTIDHITTKGQKLIILEALEINRENKKLNIISF